MGFMVCENVWPPAEDQPFKKPRQKKKAHNSEADLSTVIIKKLNGQSQRTVICQKCHGSAYGQPTLDIFGSCDGRFFWLEVKQPGQKPTSRQVNTMKKWIAKGAIASWTDSVEGAMVFIYSDWFKLTDKQMLEGFHV